MENNRPEIRELKSEAHHRHSSLDSMIDHLKLNRLKITRLLGNSKGEKESLTSCIITQMQIDALAGEMVGRFLDIKHIK